MKLIEIVFIILTFYSFNGLCGTLNNITFYNDELGIITGDTSLIQKTLNGGNTWSDISLDQKFYINDSHIFDENRYTLIGDDGVILSTLNGGSDWLINSLNMNVNLNAIDFYDGNGVLVGDNGMIWYTNNGEVWEKSVPATVYLLNDVVFINKDIILAVGAGGTIVRSINAGKDWQIIETGYAKNLNAIQFSSELCGYIVGDNGLILQTNNGGISWSSFNTDINKELTSIDVNDKGEYVVVGCAGLIGIINDGEWDLFNSEITSKNLTDVAFVCDNKYLTIGEESLIYPVITEDSSLIITSNFFLQEAPIKVYPNPIVDKLYFKSDKNIEAIKIYDIEGRLKYFNHTTEAYVVDMTEFISGVYIIEVIYNKNIIWKKMLYKQ